LLQLRRTKSLNFALLELSSAVEKRALLALGSKAFACPPDVPKKLMEILHQLGGLIIGSVPTMVFFILLVAAYGLLVRRPLEKTLAERHARTSGAVEQAHGAIAAAEAETTAYEDKLRAARNEILAARERRLQQWQQERDQALESARAAAQERVKAARKEIEATSSGARKQIEEATAQLSEQILRAILPAGTEFSEARQ
jgi:F-type H+-transporting ATPase subunit b